MIADKPLLRAALLTRRAGVPAGRRREIDEGLAVHAPAIAALAGAETVSGFWPIRDEIDPRPLFQALHQLGTTLALPVVTRGRLIFRLWRPGDALVEAAFGLMEPKPSAPTLTPAVMLVPLLGFDRQGGRIGYGKGYYDGAIAGIAPRLTIGLAFACQEVEAVPLEPHDQRLQFVLTEDGLIDCRAGSGE